MYNLLLPSKLFKIANTGRNEVDSLIKKVQLTSAHDSQILGWEKIWGLTRSGIKMVESGLATQVEMPPLHTSCMQSSVMDGHQLHNALHPITDQGYAIC